MILRGNVFSQILEMDTGISVVLPNQLRLNEEYKVVYLLHGLCGNHETWIQYSMLADYARWGNTIYIMPEAARSFYTDMQYGLPYFTYITEELPMICKNLFRISEKREHTGIIGSSMGGYGALKAAFTKPEQYGMCGAFSSPCLFLKESLEELKEHEKRQQFVEQYGEKILQDFTAAFGENFEWKAENEILELAKKMKDCKEKPLIYITCGKQDSFFEYHIRLKKEMENLKIPFIFEDWEAGHTFDFFDKSLKKAVNTFDL